MVLECRDCIGGEGLYWSVGIVLECRDCIGV